MLLAQVCTHFSGLAMFSCRALITGLTNVPINSDGPKEAMKDFKMCNHGFHF